MHLIDISQPTRLKFVEVTEPSLVRYAILSHVWNKPDGNGVFTPEPTFQDLSAAMKKSCALPEGPMFAKLTEFIRVARAGGYVLLWADMCCIDKTSSAEVSEAIASMYYWYLCAEVCYAYLKDVPYPTHEPDSLTPRPPPEFSRSSWFKRGWTLQELIASKSIIFLSVGWKILGTKRGLSRIIRDITNIDVRVLTHERKLHEVSVACRMSWAANRSTERVEDRAYSLMGLFGIRIPVLYGEREYAFIRLQEEILRRIPDPTLLAWGPQRHLSTSPFKIPKPEPVGSTRREATEMQTIHVRACRQRFSPHSDWDGGYLLATSPDAFGQAARLTKSAPQIGSVSISPSRTVLRGGGPYRQNIIPFDMFQMYTPLVLLKRATPTETDQPCYLIPLGCETAKAEPIALLLCPGASSGQTRSSALTKDHRFWVIGDSVMSPNGDASDRCRIVTLPPQNCATGQESDLLKRWKVALDAEDQEVYLPLSAPMDHWNAGDPMRADVAERLLSGSPGLFEIRLSGWCKSAMEASGFTIAQENPRPKNPRYTFTLWPPSMHSLYVKEGGHHVEAFEIIFANCPPQRQSAEGEVFPLVGSINPQFKTTHSPTTPSTTAADRQSCSSCLVAAADHLGTSGSWSFRGGVAVRTLECFVGRSRKPFMLSVGLRALLPSPHESKPTSQTYLLEIEFYRHDGTTMNKLKVAVPGTPATPFVEPRADMSPSAKPSPSGH